jgi:hypothetical protein
MDFCNAYLLLLTKISSLRPFRERTVRVREKCKENKVVENLIPDHENFIRFQISLTVLPGKKKP